MSGLKLYYDSMSQPSRALLIFLRKCEIPFEAHAVALRKGEHRESWFEKLNPFKKVPVIEHNGKPLFESVGIVRYICREFPIEDHWYPKDSYKQAKVDEFLEWHHLNTRYGCAFYFFYKFLSPMWGPPVSESQVEQAKKRMEVALDQMDSIWLKENKFLCGNEITVADIFGACEVEQPRMAGYDPLTGRPHLTAWMQRVKETLNPIYDEEHDFVYKTIEKFKGVPPADLSKL